MEIADYAFPESVVQAALNKLSKELLQTHKPVPLISFRLHQSKIPQPFATVDECSHRSAVQESTTQLGRLSHVDGDITKARCIINSGEGPPSVHPWQGLSFVLAMLYFQIVGGFLCHMSEPLA